MSRDGGNPRVGRLAHDVANALARAVSRLSLLAEQALPERANADLRDALDAIGDARERLREILEESRGDRRTRFSLLDAWRRAEEPLGEANVPTKLDAAGADTEVLADPDPIATILTSVIETERATAGAGLRVAVRREGNRVALDVRSSAPPFPAADLERLRDPFFLKKPDGFGDGLGFAICSRIAARSGGTFAVGNVEGGRHYRLELPAAKPVPARAAGPAPAKAAVGGRCLLVDDDARVRESCALMLRHLGFAFEAAASGTEALGRLAAGSFDVVILDLNLGKPVDGDEVLAGIERERPELLRRTIIATGDPTGEVVARFSQTLGVAVLPKPFGVDELRAALARLETK